MITILAIHAHPDDIETLGAGTLAVLAEKGHAVKIVTVTAGDCGSNETEPAETAVIRKGEATAAAALIGADYRCADIPDLCVFNDDPCRRRVTEMIRWAAPDIVLTASPVDYHPDHEAVSVLVRDACFAASVPNYRTGDAEVLKGIPHLYYMDPIGGRDREGARWSPTSAAMSAPSSPPSRPCWPPTRARTAGSQSSTTSATTRPRWRPGRAAAAATSACPWPRVSASTGTIPIRAPLCCRSCSLNPW
uniref:PIG-L family deacetylase n=1 Tax=Phenylobacterium glaciei TaxID=2803784 RepID=A0A974P692_9CAUL|nr:PIG-L family deacetylase [Phenylobacterium glaciei]